MENISDRIIEALLIRQELRKLLDTRFGKDFAYMSISEQIVRVYDKHFYELGTHYFLEEISKKIDWQECLWLESLFKVASFVKAQEQLTASSDLYYVVMPNYGKVIFNTIAIYKRCEDGNGVQSVDYINNDDLKKAYLSRKENTAKLLTLSEF